MYHHHHSQQQGSPPFSNGPRPPHHQPPPNQHQNRPPSDMLSQVMGFQFPRPTQLPDELESALSIRGARDMDNRLIDHMSRPNQHQNQNSGSVISQHGSYGSNPGTLTSDNHSTHQQGIDWSSYQPPAKLFASPSPSASHQSQRHQGPQQQPKSSHAETNISSWTASVSETPLPQARQPLGGGSVGSGDGQGLYTPESAGSILASFGLSNEDLEVLSHYPDDQLTPDTLPFILRDIQINKSGNQKTVASSSLFSRSIHDIPPPPSLSSPLARSHSPEVPSLLTVTQTAGKVIDYGHSSRSKDESSTRETFKRELLTTERTVKMYPSSSSSSSAQNMDKAEGRQVHLEHTESSKHGDRDYRRTTSDHLKSSRSPGREFPPSSKSRNLDRDYRRDAPKPRPSSETRSDTSSRRSLSSSSGSKPHNSSSSKKLPTPTMISDFSSASPKVYPHTCSLCHIQCDQEKDWVDHINTVNHTAACRDLRNKYPEWKPNLPRRYGSQALWDPKDQSPSHSISRSLSCSPTSSPPHNKHRGGPPLHRPRGRPYTPRHQHYTEYSHSGSHRTSSSSREHHPEKRDRESSGCSSHSGGKHLQEDSTKFSTDASRRPFSTKAGHSSKHGPLHSTRIVKSGTKPGTRMNKMASAKAADTSAKPPPAKKKKKVVTPASQDSFADRLVYVTGIPKDASEQEVTDLVGSFGKINNVVLMPCSEEESERAEGQKASVCMVKAEDAQALANSTSLTIREQSIITSLAKKPSSGQSLDANSKPATGPDKGAAGEGGEADQKPADEKGMVLITGLPESDWSESDIMKLVQPFGTPSDIILARQMGKVLVSVPDVEIAQEIVKVHTFIPMKINGSELKMIHLKQCVGLSTPVSLYNLLMGSLDPLESPVPVGWSSLLVISNVPNTASGFSEVQKLVRRFGTVIKTLVLNSMVICEMATAAMALSVYKRFQKFPCIIQNNPLFFSRKPDPKASTQPKVITAYADPAKDTPANGKGCQAAAAADEEETANKEDSECPSEGMEDVNGKDNKMESPEGTVGEDEALDKNKSEGGDDAKDRLTNALPDSLAAQNTEVQDLERETSAVETVVETAGEKKGGNASEAEDDRTPAGEGTESSGSDGRAASLQVAMPELPKVTHEMVKALLEECRTRTASQPDSSTAPTREQQGETQLEAEQSIKAAETRETATQRRQTEEEEERQAREKERRAWEKEERAKRERERNERARQERERREKDRRERERRDRKRASDEGLSGPRWSCRLEGYKQSSCRKDQHARSEAGTKAVEEESDEFPFNMSDFVTVDEVGDVTDLPCLPSPTIASETVEGGEDAPISVQKDSLEDTPTEASTETRVSHATASPVKCEDSSDTEVSAVCTATGSDGMVSSHLTPGQVLTCGASPSPASQSDASLSQTHVLTCQPEAPATASLEFAPAPTPAAAPARSGTEEVTTDSEECERGYSANHRSQAEEEEQPVALDRTKDHEKMRDGMDKEAVAPAAEPGKHKRSEEHTDTEEESVRKKLKKETPMSSDYSLPPYTPRNPIGMEFLVPKTGFFCKVCNRFYSGAKEAEITHCKTLKHYESLQKFLQTTKKANVTTKQD